MPKVLFTQSRIVEVTGGENQEFKAGEVYDLTETSAERWIRRGVAELHTGRKPRASKAAPAPDQAESSADDNAEE